MIQEYGFFSVAGKELSIQPPQCPAIVFKKNAKDVKNSYYTIMGVEKETGKIKSFMAEDGRVYFFHINETGMRNNHDCIIRFSDNIEIGTDGEYIQAALSAEDCVHMMEKVDKEVNIFSLMRNNFLEMSIVYNATWAIINNDTVPKKEISQIAKFPIPALDLFEFIDMDQVSWRFVLTRNILYIVNGDVKKKFDRENADGTLLCPSLYHVCLKAAKALSETK